jgi:phospholipid/cholesterol/gamma-HCH transport system substrate-binding protein
MARSFRERNPVTIGAVGLVAIALLLWAAFNAQNLPLIGSGTTYTAAFAEAAGLRTGDEVRIAGVKVGTVTGLDLQGDHVRVTFRVKDAWVGDESRAEIRIRTLLGRKYLAVDPRGEHRLRAGGQIPLDRTTAPFDVLEAFSTLSTTVDTIDTRQLAQAFDTLADTFRNTPQDVRRSITGLSRLSRTIASRDAQLRTLLARTRSVSAVLADRSGDLSALVADGTVLLQEVQRRRQVIHDLLQNTSLLALQLQGLVQDNQAQLAPVLDQVRAVLRILQDNQVSLDRGIALLGPFVRVFTNTLGNGRWFDTYVQNLLTPVPPALQVVPTGGQR